MIKFQNVRKTYKNSGVEALKGVSFLIDEGEFVFIIGKSGSGKSTLLKCMNCEERPNEGTITIDGFPISDMPRALVPVLRRQIGMIFQDFRLIETKTVAENISFAGEMIGLTKKSLHQKVQLVLNIVGLKDKADAYPQQLSGGEQQRIAIARAMLNNPKIIIADEPTGNLDPETSENIMGLLLDINRSGTTVIVCTHDANMVDKMKKRVIEIENGIVVRDKEDSAYADDTPAEEIPLPSLNVAFGDDAFGPDSDYQDDYDEASYVEEKPPVGDFFFGDTPPSAAVPVVPVAAAVPASVKAPVHVAPAAPAVTDESDYDDAEVAFGDEITDISDLLIENDAGEESAPAQPALPETSTESEIEAGETIVPEFTGAAIPQDPEENPFEVSSVKKEEAPAEVSETSNGDEEIEEIPLELHFPSDPEPEVPSETSTDSEEEPVEDDSWLKAVRMDDIDLDIQEDDE